MLTALTATRFQVTSNKAEWIDFAVPTGSLTINAAGARSRSGARSTSVVPR